MTSLLKEIRNTLPKEQPLAPEFIHTKYAQDLLDFQAKFKLNRKNTLDDICKMLDEVNALKPS